MDHLSITELWCKLVQTTVNTTVVRLAVASPSPDEQTAPVMTSQPTTTPIRLAHKLRTLPPNTVTNL